MHVLKKILRGLAGFSLPIFLLLAANLFLFSLTLGQPATVKGWLNKSGAYARVPDLALNELAKSPDSGQSFSDPGVKAAVKDVLKPELLQSWSENFIDGIYNWLEQKTPQPDFMLDLTPLRQGVSGFIRTRLNSLPACGRQSPPQSDEDFLAITCLPPGTDINAMAGEFEQQLFSGDGLFSKPAITAADMENEETGENPFQTLGHAPSAFGTLGKLPYVFSALAILAAVILVWLHDEKRRAWRKIAHTFLTIGLLLLVSGALGLVLFSQSNTPAADATNAMEAVGMPLIREIVKNVSRVQVWFGAAYTLVAVAGYIWLKKTAPKAPPSSSKTK